MDDITSRNMVLPRTGGVTFKILLYTNPLLTVSVCAGFVILVSVMIVLSNIYRMKERIMQVTAERASDGQEAVDLFSGHPEGYYD